MNARRTCRIAQCETGQPSAVRAFDTASGTGKIAALCHSLPRTILQFLHRAIAPAALSCRTRHR
jgi:hypothetical protein